MNALIETTAAYDLEEEEMTTEEYGLREQQHIEKELAKQQAEYAARFCRTIHRDHDRLYKPW